MIKPLTVFIIDDDEDDREMFLEVLIDINRSHKCMTASNGQEALHLLEKTEILPDFIFLDLNMPRMNGRQCLKQLKSSERLAPVPIVIYSTSKLDSDREETMRLGAAHFLTKPNSMQQLKKELEFVLSEEFKSSLTNYNGFSL